MKTADTSTVISYVIDRNDGLASVSGGWDAFALANHGAALVSTSIHGRPLWDFLTDATTIQLYAAMLQGLRDGAPAIHFRFRCDAPDRRRLLAMDITAEADRHVRFDVTSIIEQARDSVALLDPDRRRDERILVMCGWCKRSRLTDGTWVETETAVQTMRLFEDVSLPDMSHGMCDMCHTNIARTFEDSPGDVTLGGFQP